MSVMESTGEQQFDLSEYRVISIEDNHKLAIVSLLNSIISEEPLLEDLNETKSVVWRLGSLINFFDQSFISGHKELKMPALEEMDDSALSETSSYIRNWLISYYNADSVIESLKLEDGIQEEIAMAALLILNVFYQLRGSLPQVKTYFEMGWIYLSEFEDQLEAMWKTDRAVSLLQTELECERIQRLADKQKVTKLQKELSNIKTKLQQSKATVEKLKKYVEKPAPKSKKRGSVAVQNTPESRRRGRPKKSAKVEMKYGPTESDIEPDTPPAPGTPVLLSSSGTGSSCRYCGKWFNESIKLNRHMVIHAGAKPFACDWPGCGRPFDSNYKLQRHRRCHTGERPFACDTCEKRFTRSDKLREHQRLHQRVNNKKPDVNQTNETKPKKSKEENNNSHEVDDTEAVEDQEGVDEEEAVVAENLTDV